LPTYACTRSTYTYTCLIFSLRPNDPPAGRDALAIDTIASHGNGRRLSDQPTFTGNPPPRLARWCEARPSRRLKIIPAWHFAPVSQRSRGPCRFPTARYRGQLHTCSAAAPPAVHLGYICRDCAEDERGATVLVSIGLGGWWRPYGGVSESRKTMRWTKQHIVGAGARRSSCCATISETGTGRERRPLKHVRPRSVMSADDWRCSAASVSQLLFFLLSFGRSVVCRPPPQLRPRPVRLRQDWASALAVSLVTRLQPPARTCRSR